MTKGELLRVWEKHSDLMWGRLQTVSLIEGGALAGWYQLSKEGDQHLGGAVLLLSLILLLGVSLLAKRDSDYIGGLEKQNIPLNKHDVGSPLLGLHGRTIAIGVPLTLAFANLGLYLWSPEVRRETAHPNIVIYGTFEPKAISTGTRGNSQSPDASVRHKHGKAKPT